MHQAIPQQVLYSSWTEQWGFSEDPSLDDIKPKQNFRAVPTAWLLFVFLFLGTGNRAVF